MDLLGLVHGPKLGTLVEAEGPLSVHKHKNKHWFALKVFCK